jgi:ATP-dependent RNA helicase DDX18/HAS1
LRKAKIPLNEYEFPTSKLANITEQFNKLIERNYYLNCSAKDGYKSYLQAYASHKLRDIYDVNALDLKKIASAFGLAVPPRVNLSKSIHSF